MHGHIQVCGKYLRRRHLIWCLSHICGLFTGCWELRTGCCALLGRPHFGRCWRRMSCLSIGAVAKAFDKFHCWSSSCRCAGAARLWLRCVGTANPGLRRPWHGVLSAGGALRGH